MPNPFTALRLTRPTSAILQVMLTRAASANALNTNMAEELVRAFNELPADCRVIILTGEGQRTFCAGADLKERQGMDEAAWEAQHSAFRAARDAVLVCPLPVIAAVNGAAYGGGLELALACDIIYAAATARFALPEATLGIMPGLGGTQLLPRAIGCKRAAEMLFTGTPVDAAQALAMGLVNQVVPQALLSAEVLALAERIAQAAPLSMRAIKRALREGEGKSLSQALAAELTNYHALLATHDRVEGIGAFNEKRQAVFTGT